MADLILPERFTSQPQYAAPVDRSNPSSRGLVFLYSAAANADAALLGPPTLQNTGSLGATARGIALKGNAAGYQKWTSAGPLATSEMTVLSVVVFNGATFSTCSGLSDGVEFVSYNTFGCYRDGSTTFVGTSGFAPSVAGSSGTPSPTPFVIYGSFKSGVTNGSFVGVDQNTSADGTATLTALTGSQNPGVGKDYNGNSVNAVGNDIVMTAVWNRAILRSELAFIVANPWQLYRAPGRRMWTGGAVPNPVGSYGQFDPDLRLSAWF